ncbi:hypothetical protein ABK040_011978 [Willaertia magna]
MYDDEYYEEDEKKDYLREDEEDEDENVYIDEEEEQFQEEEIDNEEENEVEENEEENVQSEEEQEIEEESERVEDDIEPFSEDENQNNEEDEKSDVLQSEINDEVHENDDLDLEEEEEDDESMEELNELEQELMEVINNIPEDFVNYEAKSHVTIVAESLNNNSYSSDLETLTEYYNDVNGALSKIVSFSYESFNKSIKNFSDMLVDLHASQSKIHILNESIKNSKQCLRNRINDLSTLYTNYLQHTEYLRILNLVKKVKMVPQQIQGLIEKKHFAQAVTILLKSSKFLKESEELKYIKGLDDIKNSLKQFQTNLPDLMIDALITHLYKVDEDSITNRIEKGDVKDFSTDKSKQLSRKRTLLLKTPLFYEKAFSMVQNMPNEEIDFELDNFDPNFNPEEDSNYFLAIIIDALDSLKKLSLLQSRMVHSLKFDLRSLIEKHLLEYTKFIEEYGHELTWKILQAKQKSTPSEIALIQGGILSELFNKVFSSIYQVLKKYKLMIGIMQLKVASLDFGNNEDNSESDEKQVATPLDIKVTKQVQTKIGKAIKEEIDKTKEQILKSKPKLVTPFKLYLAVLTDLENNFLMGVSEEEYKVKDIVKLFETQIELQDKGNNSSKLKEKFTSLLINSVSDADTPHIFTAIYVWKTAQEEMKTLIKEILGLADIAGFIETFQSREEDHSDYSHKSIIETGVPKTIDDYNMNFKFTSNIEPTFDTKTKTVETLNENITIISPLLNHFVLTPYNSLWLYKEINDFVEMCNNVIFDGMENKTEGENFADLKSFVDEIIRHYFIPLIKSDFRGKLNESLKSDFSEAFFVNEISVPTLDSLFDGADKRSIFYGSTDFVQYLNEIFVMSNFLPKFKADFNFIIDLLFKRYLDECTTFYQITVAGTYCYEVLKQTKVDIYKFLTSDPRFKKVQPWITSNSNNKKFNSENFRNTFEELIDSPIHCLKFSKQFPQSLFITRKSGFIALAALNHSMDWLASQIYKLHKQTVEQALISRNTSNEFYSQKQNMEQSKYKSLAIDSESVVALLATSNFQTVKYLGDYFDKFVTLSNECLLAIKIDLRVHCVYHIERSFKINLKLNNGKYYDFVENLHHPETFIINFNSEIMEIYKVLSTYLSNDKLNYVFHGIGRFVANLLVNSMVDLVLYENLTPKFSPNGIKTIKCNIFALRHNLTSIANTPQTSFDHALQFFEMLNLSESKLIKHAMDNQKSKIFAKEHYLSIIKSDGPRHTPEKPQREKELEAIFKSKQEQK